MRIGGRFVGEFAEEARTLLSLRKTTSELRVDISDVTSVDAAGEEVRKWLRITGVKFIAKRSYSLQICQRLHLPTIHGWAELEHVDR